VVVSRAARERERCRRIDRATRDPERTQLRERHDPPLTPGALGDGHEQGCAAFSTIIGVNAAHRPIVAPIVLRNYTRL
jgi:hypothetical protein